MSDYWQKKYSDLVDFLEKEYGAGWVLGVLDAIRTLKALRSELDKNKEEAAGR